MSAAVRTAFDVAFWFADTALNDNEYLQPQKLHRLLFLAQGYYAVVAEGRALMPAFFVADEMGPVEPNLFAAFSKGRPDVDVELFLPDDVEMFLTSIWRRFGHHAADKLTRMTKETLAYKQAFKKGPRSEITLEAMRLSMARAEQTPGVAQVVKPKVLRTQDGRPVQVKAWQPKVASPEDVVVKAEQANEAEELLAMLGLAKPKPRQAHPKAAAPPAKAWAPKAIRKPRGE